jgi:hypothetical protein
MHRKVLWILLLVIYVSSAAARTDVSSVGIAGSVHLGGDYMIESAGAPGMLFEDDGGTGRYEVISISPSKTIYSSQYAVYSDNFDTDKWNSDKYSSYGIDRSKGIIQTKYVLYPTILNEEASVKYNFNFSSAVQKAAFEVTGNRRDTEHNLSVWASKDNKVYTKIIDFDKTADDTKKVYINDYIENNQTWIEFRFYRSSMGDNTPRILDFSLEALYETVPSLNVYSIAQNTAYQDDFWTNKWETDRQSFYLINRSIGIIHTKYVLYPVAENLEAYVRYLFNVTGNATLKATGNRRDLKHNLTLWASKDNITYSKIIEFDQAADDTKTTDITNYIKNNQTWIEFRFYDNSTGNNTPRILGFSINTTRHEWRPANMTIGGDIELPTNTIDRDHFYYFAPHYPSPAGVTAARIAYLGTKYAAIDVNSQHAVLGNFVQNDADLVLTYGTPLSLGSGFVLEIEDIGAKDNQAVVLLKKDGKLLDRGVYEAGKTYSFKTEVAGVNNTEVLKANVISVFKSSFNSRVELKHVYLLDTSATIIKQGDSFGDFEVDLTDFDKDKDTDITIRLKKDATFTLARNSTIDLFGGLSIKVADSDDLRFAVIKKYTKSGTYQQSGPYGKYGQPYNTNSFDAPGLFTYDIDKNDTLESLSISSGTNRINDIRYSTFNKNNRIAYLGKTYNAVPSGGKIALNEILKDDNEKTTIKYGSPLYIEGYTLELLDVGERTALLQLKKGNTVLEKSSVDSGNSFVYKKSIEGKDVEIFNATVKSVFRSDFAALVELENLVLLNDTPLIVKDGDTVGGDYETDVADINGDGAADIMVKLKSGKSIDVSKDSTTGILGGYMSLKAYETTFLPVRSVTVNMSVNPVSSANPAGTAQPAQSTATEPASLQAASSVEASVVETQEAEETPANSASSENLRAPPVNVVYILGSAGAIVLSISAYRWFRFRKLI